MVEEASEPLSVLRVMFPAYLPLGLSGFDHIFKENKSAFKKSSWGL